MPRSDWIPLGSDNEWLYLGNPNFNTVGPYYALWTHISYNYLHPRQTHVKLTIQELRTNKRDVYYYYPETQTWNRYDNTYGSFPYEAMPTIWRDYAEEF